MSRFILALIFALMAPGCGTMKAYLPIIDASIIGSKGITQATRDHMVSKEDVTGCYATSALITALGTSKGTIDSWVTSSVGNRVIPAVEVDITACHALVKGGIEPVVSEKANSKVQGILKAVMPSVTGVLSAVLASADVTCRDLEITKGVLKYIENAAPVVVDELANPDGKMLLPEVVLNFEGCDTSSPAAIERAAGPQCK
jgi:hypothetical protein